ncbi:hypothetical protein M378DRAFT_174354 [Amanita muscaria Koide BX008]|uniref:Uncharacterized protein n=1 Tax=Amanita muscaria (strain Koide BX008) TaxID=946122 RepID=A0A0C2WCD6_AMAMK|nr:hypothetical protein M378DRAFT_174354 [Amanita muscaria Koide BX008]
MNNGLATSCTRRMIFNTSTYFKPVEFTEAEYNDTRLMVIGCLQITCKYHGIEILRKTLLLPSVTGGQTRGP